MSALAPLWQWIAEHADKLPFVLATAGGGQQRPRFDIARIIEASIIAGTVAAAGYFFMVPKIIEGVTVEIKYMRRDLDAQAEAIDALHREQDKIRREFDRAHPDSLDGEEELPAPRIRNHNRNGRIIH